VSHLGGVPVSSAAHSLSPVVQSRSVVAPRVLSAVRVASLATANLRAALEHRSSGEDDHITIEGQRERCHCQGHNLIGDFNAVDATPVGQAAHTPTPPAGSEDGYMALAPQLHMVVWSCMFWPHLSEKYDWSVNLAEFLPIYSTSILAVRGNEAIMANYFPVALTGVARSWLMNLLEGSRTSWVELCHKFMANFKSAYTHPGNKVDLHAVRKHPGESLRSFIQRFS
jgi:hypothetical protein